MGKEFSGGTGKLELEGPSGLTFRSAGGVWTVWRRKTGIIDLIGHQLLGGFLTTHQPTHLVNLGTALLFFGGEPQRGIL